MKKRNRKELVETGGMMIMVILLLFLLYGVLGVGCPLRYVTGIACPFCGMTRAWMAFLHFDFRGAFRYHPLFWLPIVMWACFRWKNHIGQKKASTMLVIACLLLAGAYLYRMIILRDETVMMDWKSGLIFQMWKHILSL